jgi:diguanylate cyclase (GGDEF)-like protein
VAERIREGIAGEPLSAAGTVIRQTVSVGVATWNGRESAEALEMRADSALYAAKRDGRNRSAVADRGLDEARAPAT